MIKKLIKLGFILSAFLMLSSSTFAATPVDIDDLIYRPGESIERTDSPELEFVGDLPEVTLEGGVASIIRLILGWAILFSLVAIVVAGIFYLRSEGDEENVTKAKSIILYLILGMLIMAAAYGVISGIAQFKFFDE